MSDDEVEQPPARRAPSGRASKGNRMARLLAQEEDEAEEGDRDFYEQEFWADAEGDEEFAMDADDEQGNDSFDSDFGDSSDSDDEDEDEMSQKAEKAARATKSQKKSVYRDPKTKEAAGTASDAPKKPKKRRRSELSELTGLQPLQRGSLRASTKDATAAAQAKRRQAIELAEQRASQIAAKGGKNKGVEMRRLTQEEILAEAAQTEIINRASLEKMLRVEEEKRQVIVRVRDHTGPRVRTKSVREGDSVRVSCASGRHSFFELEQTTKSIASNSSPHSLFITPPRPFSRPPPANACASSSSLCHCNRQLELCPIPPPSGVLCADIRDIHRSSTSSVDGRRGAPLPATCEVRCNRTNRQVL